jgi:hypothetical protein
MNEIADAPHAVTTPIPARRSATVTCVVSGVALIVVLILANPPDAHILLFSGGWRSGLFGLAMAALIPLTIAVQIGLGGLLARMARIPAALHEPWLLWLSGSALLSLAGVAIAAAGLIGPWLCGALFVLGVGYAAGSGHCAGRLLSQLKSWFTLDDVVSDKPTLAAVRLGIVAALILVGLRAATGELNDTDVVQFYWGWLNEVRHLGGIWLSPEMPLVQDFVAGRGNGNYLFSAGLAPGLVSHAVSAVFCVMFAVGLRALVLLTAPASVPHPRTLTRLAADLACLAALWMLPGAVAFGKYHLQYAAWALGFMLTCLRIVTDDATTGRNRRLMLMPLAVAIPVGLAQFEAFVAFVLFVAVMVAPNRWSAAVRLVPLLLVGCASAGLSLLANWLYLGIPDLNPFPLFERFISEPRFSLWTSRLQQYYINSIQGGALTFKAGDDASLWRQLRSLLGAIIFNMAPIAAGLAGVLGVAIVASLSVLRRPARQIVRLLLGLLLGYALYRLSSRTAFYDLALAPTINRLALYGMASAAYLAAVRRFRDAAARSFLLGLLGYWLICATFIVVFHSGSMERLMRQADMVFVGLLLVAVVHLFDRISAVAVVVRIGARARRLHLHLHLHLRKSAAAVLLALGVAFSFHAAASAWQVDPPGHLLASTLGLEGRAVGLTHPMARFERCEEIARSVPTGARVLFLNAYTAMAYCNNAVLLPRTMIVAPHASDFARELATSAFADADTVEQTLRRMRMNYFLVLKRDSEFWVSGLSAPFRPGELERRFDLLAETPSFYVLTWRGAGRRIPPEALAQICEWRRITIQQHGFMAQNEFVGQWRAMASLGADRPKYELGSRLDFTSNGWSALYADHGWYAADPQGTWTVGPAAVLTLPLATPSAAGALRVRMEVMPFVLPQLPTRTVHVRLGAAEVATWTFGLGEDYQTREIDLPGGAAAAGKIVLTFEIENPISQYSLGLNPDWRPLGMAVRSLMVEDIAPSAK